MKKPDDLNIRILNELQNNARIANVEIGRRIGLTGPAVADRIQKMEDEGIIQGYHTSLDFDKLGLAVRVFIIFRAREIKHAEFIKMVSTLPEVLEWHTVTGDSCAILTVAVQTTRHLESLITRLQAYGETTTSIILSNSKNINISLGARLCNGQVKEKIKSGARRIFV